MASAEECEYTFTWEIKNYSCCYQTKEEDISSPNFAIENLPRSEWFLKYYPKGDDTLKNDEKFVSCHLVKSTNGGIIINNATEGAATATICYSIEIVDEKNRVLKKVEEEDREFSKKHPSWGWSRLFPIDKLAEEMKYWAEDTLTLRCRIKCRKQCKQVKFGAAALTTIDVDRSFVDWYVKMPVLFEYSESITFLVNSYSCKITLKFMSEAWKILIQFEGSNVPQQVTAKISIFDRIGCKLGSKRDVHPYKKTETWNFPELITKELIKDCKINSSNYEFKLQCEVYISRDETLESIKRMEFVTLPSVKCIPSDSPISSMQKDYRNFFLNKNFSDVKLRCKGDEFPAHKFVLSVRSPVFAAMFHQEMLENQTGVVDVADLDVKNLKALLEFLYTGTVSEMDYDIAKNLILAADKYQVLSLVDVSASCLKSVVSVKNVCEIISIADLVGCDDLKSYAYNFIKCNAAEILSTVTWSQWIEGNVKLATYILSKLSAAIRDEC